MRVSCFPAAARTTPALVAPTASAATAHAVITCFALIAAPSRFVSLLVRPRLHVRGHLVDRGRERLDVGVDLGLRARRVDGARRLEVAHFALDVSRGLLQALVPLRADLVEPRFRVLQLRGDLVFEGLPRRRLWRLGGCHGDYRLSVASTRAFCSGDSVVRRTVPPYPLNCAATRSGSIVRTSAKIAESPG